MPEVQCCVRLRVKAVYLPFSKFYPTDPRRPVSVIDIHQAKVVVDMFVDVESF